MPWKFKNFDCEEDDHARHHNNGNVKIREKNGIIEINEPGGGGWQPLPPAEDPPADFEVDPRLDFAYVSGSRWVYINGRWYRI